MVTGTLVRTPELIREAWPDKTADVSTEIPTSEEEFGQQLLRDGIEPGLYYRAHDALFADTTYFGRISKSNELTTSGSDWDTTPSGIPSTVYTVWDTPKLQKLLTDPVGAPIELTLEEADEIVRIAAGRRPDLPPGKEVTKEIREVLGHSLMQRLKKVD